MILGISYGLFAQTQNGVWSLTPKYSKITPINFQPAISLPNIVLPAQNASNAMLDANDELKFFIVDNNIYDDVGDLIGNIKNFYNANNPYPRTCLSVSSTSEIMIIPDPSNCGRYYILTSTTMKTDCIFNKPGSHASVPVMAVIDFNVPRPSNPTKFGAITSVDMLSNLPSLNAQGIDYWVSGAEGGNLFSASRLKNDGEENFRFVFVSLRNSTFGYGVLRLRLNSNGLVYDGFLAYDDQTNIHGSRSEMELVELVNGNYRIAAPYGFYSSVNGVEIISAIYTADLDIDGEVVTGSENTLYFTKNPMLQNDRPYIHGIEFSPDGSKLFISHNISDYHPSPFEYFDFNSPNPNDPINGIYPLNIGSSSVNEADFQNSHIELASDGSIYLGADQRLAKLTSPNTPLASNFTDNSVMVSGYVANYGVGNQDQIYKTYTLPDQIDGMNYQNFAPTAYNEISYTALGSGTWQPGNGSNPWDATGEVFIKDELIIPSGRSVTIQNMTFRFGPNAKVIIEQGAKLTIDDATLTNARPCNNEELYWQGVQVYGTTNQHQAPANNPAYQGMLELKNGGTIENAHKAATNWNEGSWSEIGGVIKSTNGVFRNNRRGVEFMEYQNFHPSNPTIKRDNTSRFTGTEFLTDDNFIEGYPQQPYVTLWKVHGIIFENCHFANNVTTNKSLSSSPNEGISTLDASFKVVPRCDSPPLPYGTPCPTGLLMKSSFEGLEYAIQVAGAGVSEAVTISQTDFTNNIWGVRVKEFDNVNINRNDFVIGNGGYSNSTYSGNGIFLDNSVEYIVEENSVLNTLSSGKTSGIVVDYGGPLDNKVYKNTLSNLFEGTKSNRVNRSVDLKYGLQFLCNDYLNNENAIVINASDNSHGVRLNQGDFYSQTSSGNTFQFNTLDIVDYANQINYYHSGGITLPNMTNGVIGPVQEVLVNNKNACPTSFKPGVVMFHELLTKLNDYETELVNHKTAYNILNYNYISLIDNGDTDILQGQIENNWSSDAWTLRNNLMQESPYLSTEALLTAAGENVLPNAMLLEVLLANPDATKGEEFITELNDVLDSDLPEYMLNYVRNNWDTETVRTIMEGEMSFYQSKIATATNFIKYLEKSKDEYTYSERHNTVLMGEGISNKIGVMDFFIENNQWLKADSVLQAINSDESLQADIGLIEDFDNYITFRSSLGSRNIAQLDATEVQYLETLAEKGSRASGYAENILCFFYDICYEKEVPEGGGMAKMLTIPAPSGDEPTLEELMYNITVYPNPASDFTSIKWEIYDELNNSHYKIFDLNGREMGSGAIEENEGEQVIDTRSLRNGVYIINIYNEGVMKMNSKLIVSKEK